MARPRQTGRPAHAPHRRAQRSPCPRSPPGTARRNNAGTTRCARHYCTTFTRLCARSWGSTRSYEW
eukprot:7963303-Pyramimonas_sp.AAC.1